jgi:hypothetical protein
MSGIIAANIFQEDDASCYKRGNRIFLSLLVINIFLYLGTKVCYVKWNALRDRRWEGMTEDEKLHYFGHDLG